MNRLYKSDSNRVFDGVCGGLGEYFGIDPVIIRLIWVLLALFGGTGILAYLIAMLIIPRQTGAEGGGAKHHSARPLILTNKFWGAILLILGALMVLRFMDPLLRVILSLVPVIAGIILPGLLLVGGLYLIFRKEGDGSQTRLRDMLPSERKLTRDPENGKLAGVCAGFALYFDVDANLVRLIWIMLAFASMGFVSLAYVLFAIFLPQSDPLEVPPSEEV